MTDENFQKQLGFKPQKSVIYLKHLPYADRISEEIVDQLRDAKENLSKAVLLRDIKEGCSVWVDRLSRFLGLYGLCISKEDHILLIKLLYELAVIPNQDFWLTTKFCYVLNALLSKQKLLSPDELQLPWRPLYDLYVKLIYSSSSRLLHLPSNAACVLQVAIAACRTYFPITTTSELLEELFPKMCPDDAVIKDAFTLLELFLPMNYHPDQAHMGWKLYMDELIGFFCTYTDTSWEDNLFGVLSRLAWDYPGYIDWEPHLPLVFTKILRSLQLPVTFKNQLVTKRSIFNTTSVCNFIVANLGGGSKTQEHLDQLFKATKSYYHPSNYGIFTLTLHSFVKRLSHSFVMRLYRERYKKLTWETPIPNYKKLMEDDITQFVACIQPIATLVMFSRSGSLVAGGIFLNLAILRPAVVIPPLLEQLYAALNTVVEPHRLKALLHSVMFVSQQMVAGEPDYPEGKTHLFSLLMHSLPGIDFNDAHKCIITLSFIANLVNHVPLVNCSAALEERSDLTEIEHEVCLQTAGFEDFVMQFFDKCFNLIESSALEQVTSMDRETESMNQEESLIKTNLSLAFTSILTQCHPKIYKAALEHIVTFTTGRCLETRVAGNFVGIMCRAAVKVNPEEALKAFVPSICRLVVTLTDSDEIQQAEQLGNEILFNLLLLSQLSDCSSHALTDYLPEIMQVLQQTLHLNCKEGYKLAGSILRQVLVSLSFTSPVEYRSITQPWDEPLSEFLPVHHWGKAGDVDNLQVKWFEPGEKEERAISALVHAFLVPALRDIKYACQGTVTLTKERLHQNLCIICSILFASTAFPQWDEEELKLVEMSVTSDTKPLILQSKVLRVDLTNCPEFPSNVRLAIAETILELVDDLSQKESDDTKGLSHAVNILVMVMFHEVIDFSKHSERNALIQSMKKLSNKLLKEKRHVRFALIERVMLQHEKRALEGRPLRFTATHKRILECLTRLSTSHYSEVRKNSQRVVSKVFITFPHSHKLVLPWIIDILKKDPSENQALLKQFKGALYLVIGTKDHSLIVHHDWETMSSLWPAIVSAKHSEVPSVIRLYRQIDKTLYGFFQRDSIYLQVPDGVLSAAKNLSCSSNPAVSQVPTEEEVEVWSCKLKERVNNNFRLYHELIDSLLQHIKSGVIHWNHYRLALKMLGLHVRADVTFPAPACRAIVTNIINDNIYIRQIALYYTPHILNSQKRAHKKIQIDPYSVDGSHPVPEMMMPGDSRPDNAWLQYSGSSVNMTEEEWESPRYVHKTYIGWYTWPKVTEVYAPPSQQPSLERTRDELEDGEKEVLDFFTSERNVEKLMSFLSLDENSSAGHIFKRLFRNFGDKCLDVLVPHLQKLVEDPQVTCQRCASQVIAGVVCGSKHWPYHMAKRMMDIVCQLLTSAMDNLTVETLGYWGKCMTHISMDRDPNRLASLFELMMDNPLREKQGTFIASSHLYLLFAFVRQQEWRVMELLHRLLETFRLHLSHPYRTIRQRIGSLLQIIFMHDTRLPWGVKSRSPSIDQFVDTVLPQLNMLIQELGSGPDHILASSFPSSDASLTSSPFRPTEASLSLTEGPVDVVSSVDVGAEASSGEVDAVKEFYEISMSSSALPVSMADDGVSPSLEGKSSFPSPVSSPTNGYLIGETEERQTAILLMNTICHWLSSLLRIQTTLPLSIYRYLPHLCQLESVDNDQELKGNCVAVLALLSSAVVPSFFFSNLLQIMEEIGKSRWWRARAALLAFLQVTVFNNMFTLLNDAEAPDKIKELVMSLLHDPRIEVRQMASQVLGGLIHCNFINPDEKLLMDFTSKLEKSKGLKKQRRREESPSHLIDQHAGVLGLCAYVNAYPYDIPELLPEVLVTLSDHVHGLQPISATIKKTLGDFKRTHFDNWRSHKQKFTSDQLAILNDLLISPTYFA